VIITYQSDSFKGSNGEFWTDSNGRQNIKRVRNQRFSFDFEEADYEVQPVSSNYYPLTTGMYISSGDQQMSVLIDRGEGASSINDGEIEVMLHRRCLFDDHRGVGEPIDEIEYGERLIATGKHRIFIGQELPSINWRRMGAQEGYLAPTTLFHPAPEDWRENDEYVGSYSSLTEPTDNMLNVMTVDRWSEGGDVLVRLEHLYEKAEMDLIEADNVVEVQLDRLFRGLQYEAAEEMTLGADRKLADTTRLHWTTATFPDTHTEQHSMEKPFDGQTVTLQPMEIRTFILRMDVNVEGDDTTIGPESKPDAASTRGPHILLILIAFLMIHLK